MALFNRIYGLVSYNTRNFRTYFWWIFDCQLEWVKKLHIACTSLYAIDCHLADQRSQQPIKIQTCTIDISKYHKNFAVIISRFWASIPASSNFSQVLIQGNKVRMGRLWDTSDGSFFFFNAFRVTLYFQRDGQRKMLSGRISRVKPRNGCVPERKV